MTDTDDDDLLLENLTPATIHQIAWEVADKTHDPKDAKRLLWKYIELVDKEEVLPVPLDRYARDSFKRHFEGEKLETAFGLTPGKRRGADEHTQQIIVIEVWKKRLSGMTHQDAVAEVSGRYGVWDSTVGRYWKSHRMAALELHRFALGREGMGFSPAQKKIIKKVFRNSNEKVRRLLESERMERDSQDAPKN